MGALRRVGRVIALLALATAAGSNDPALAQATRAGVYVDDSPQAEEGIKKALHLHGQRRLADAAGQLHRLVEEHADKVTGGGEDGLYVSVRHWATRFIASDPALLEAYRRFYEPAAQRELVAASRGWPSIERLAVVSDRYALCEAGLEATLRQAALALEAGLHDDAAGLLDAAADHPLGAKHTARRLELRGMAAMMAGDTPGLARVEAELARLAQGDQAGAGRAREALGRFGATLRRPSLPRVLSPLGPQPAAQLPASLGRPLWVRPTGWPATTVRRAADGPGSVHTLPTVVGDAVYLNDGLSVIAIERSSGQALWPQSYRLSLTPGEQQILGTFQRGSVAFDQRNVAVCGDRLVVSMGRGPIWPAHLTRNRVEGYLVGLDRQSGREAWKSRPVDLDASIDGAVLQGQVEADGLRAYVMLRRPQANGVQDAFVLAVRVADGSLAWKQKLSSVSAGDPNRRSAPPSILLSGGRLYATDHQGSVACLESRSGAILWLRTLAPLGEADGRDDDFAARTMVIAHLSPPVLLPAGLVVATPAHATPAMLLDPRTGRAIRPLDGVAWRRAIYLAPVGDDLLAVSEHTTLFDGKTLEARRQYLLGDPPTGRVAIAGERMVAALEDRLKVFHLPSGRLEAELPLPADAEDASNTEHEPPHGHVMVTDGQVLLAGFTHLRSYMEFSGVRAMLAKAMAEHPEDPQPGLALAHASLAAGAGKTDVPWKEPLLEGVDHALAAAQARMDRALASGAVPEADRQLQRRVFHDLLAFVAPERVPDAELRRQLFDRVGRAAVEPQQEVAFALRRAAFLVEAGEPGQAVDHYQAVLEDPVLSLQVDPWDDSGRPGGLEARARMEQLIARHGPEVYAKYEDLARRQMEELKGAAAVDLKSLQRLADQYPLSTAAPQARLMAGELLAGRGEVRAAAGELRRAWVQSPPSDRAFRERVLGRLAELYLEAEQPGRAQQWLRRVAREEPTMTPLRRGKPQPLDQWMKELAAARRPIDRLPDLRLPLGKPFVITGRLLTPQAQPRASWPRDAVMTRVGATLEYRTGSRLASVWQAQAPADAELLALSDEQALLHSPQTARVHALDVRNGRPLWPAVDLRPWAGPPPPGEDAPPALRQPLAIDGQAPAAPEPTTIFALNDMVLVVADGWGKVAGIDRQTGRKLWDLRLDLSALTHVELNEEVLAVAGRWRVEDEERGVVHALDPWTGRPLFAPIGRGPRDAGSLRPPLWIGLAEGLLVALTQDRVWAHHTADGAKAWDLRIPETGLTRSAHLDGDLLLIKRTNGSLLAVDPVKGTAIGEVAGLTEQDQPMSVVNAETQWQVMSPTACFALAPGAPGLVRWRDAAAEESGARMAQLVAEEWVVMLTYPETEGRLVFRGEVAAQLPHNDKLHAPLRYQLFFMDRSTGLIVADPLITEVPQGQSLVAHQAMLLDRRILLATPRATLVIHTGEERAAQPR